MMPQPRVQRKGASFQGTPLPKKSSTVADPNRYRNRLHHIRRADDTSLPPSPRLIASTTSTATSDAANDRVLTVQKRAIIEHGDGCWRNQGLWGVPYRRHPFQKEQMNGRFGISDRRYRRERISAPSDTARHHRFTDTAESVDDTVNTTPSYAPAAASSAMRAACCGAILSVKSRCRSLRHNLDLDAGCRKGRDERGKEHRLNLHLRHYTSIHAVRGWQAARAAIAVAMPEMTLTVNGVLPVQSLSLS
jgi:hypothetical protein